MELEALASKPPYILKPPSADVYEWSLSEILITFCQADEKLVSLALYDNAGKACALSSKEGFDWIILPIKVLEQMKKPPYIIVEPLSLEKAKQMGIKNPHRCCLFTRSIFEDGVDDGFLGGSYIDILDKKEADKIIGFVQYVKRFDNLVDWKLCKNKYIGIVE
jgi:hypothetical protein